MDQPRSASGNGEDNVGIPDDLRCKRSDGKQWRCTAMSMPDKTVCEKHYIQAKKRAANSALRASLRKAKRKSVGESDIYLESKSDDDDMPLASLQDGDYPPSGSGMKSKEKFSKTEVCYSPETPPSRTFATRQPDVSQFEGNWRSYQTTPASMGSSRNRSFNVEAMVEYSDRSTSSSEDISGLTCHQCHRHEKDRLVWCMRCNRRGYCDGCISTWYSGIPLEELRRVCPACRGTCNCTICLRGDNMIKVRIREIPVLEKLQYLNCLLSSVLPIVKRIHRDQCSEVEVEKRLLGTKIDLVRTKLNADEQMCCNFCRIPIIDYHRHCARCSYDLCLSCCRELRGVSTLGSNGELLDNHITGKNKVKKNSQEQENVYRLKPNLYKKFSDWKANGDGSIPCPPKEFGGCGYSSLNVSRNFKMNWIAKLVKNVEEMVSGCRVRDTGEGKNGLIDPGLCQYAYREDGDDNFLYCPASQDIKTDGVDRFRKHWSRGEPVIVKLALDSSSFSSWDPMAIWRGVWETMDDKMKDSNRIVKAVDCFDWSEVDLELDQFIKGYSEGRSNENGRPVMLKLKDWPSPSASEEFLLYQGPKFISKLPLLEYIHSKWGLLNVAAKLPHYCLQNDAGPKILISYGLSEELDVGDSVTNLHFNMRDMVYLLVHTCDVKCKDWHNTETEKALTSLSEIEVKESPTIMVEEKSPDLSVGRQNLQKASRPKLDECEDVMVESKIISATNFEGITGSCEHPNGDNPESTHSGVFWDVFRRQDVPKLTEYLRIHWKEFRKSDCVIDDTVRRPLYEEGLFLNRHHKRKLKEDFGIEPWSFEQYLGQAVFVPAGCPFQARNLKSNVQLGLNFLSPESLSVAVALAEEIRCLPNDHEAKSQILEVGKISLYAASSAIKEVQKLVLDPKLGKELGFDDPNLTAAVSENLEKLVKQRQTACV